MSFAAHVKASLLLMNADRSDFCVIPTPLLFSQRPLEGAPFHGRTPAEYEDHQHLARLRPVSRYDW